MKVVVSCHPSPLHPLSHIVTKFKTPLSRGRDLWMAPYIVEDQAGAIVLSSWGRIKKIHYTIRKFVVYFNSPVTSPASWYFTSSRLALLTSVLHNQSVNDELQRSVAERLASDETLKNVIQGTLLPSFQQQLDYVYQSFNDTLQRELQHYAQMANQVRNKFICFIKETLKYSYLACRL